MTPTAMHREPRDVARQPRTPGVRPTADRPVGRYPVPSLEELPEDMRARIVSVHGKLGFVPNVFWTLAHALDGLNVSVFLPADWSEQEMLPAARMGGEPPRLTERELEVLRLSATGIPGPEIARRLVISPTTVKSHFENIYAKLEVPDRAAAVASALRLGLID